MTVLTPARRSNYVVSDLMRAHNRVMRLERRLLREALKASKGPVAQYTLREVCEFDQTFYIHIDEHMSIDRRVFDSVKNGYASLFRKYNRARETYEKLYDLHCGS